MHGLDIARAVKLPWQLPERDMLLVLRGAMQITPAVLRAGVPHDTDVCVTITLPEARPMPFTSTTASPRRARSDQLIALTPYCGHPRRRCCKCSTNASGR
jgi:hypothetical protein